MNNIETTCKKKKKRKKQKYVFKKTLEKKKTAGFPAILEGSEVPRTQVCHRGLGNRVARWQRRRVRRLTEWARGWEKRGGFRSQGQGQFKERKKPKFW